MVEECSILAEVVPVRDEGGYRSKNVGMSSKKTGENPVHRKPKVSWATTIDSGLGGPNLNGARHWGMEEQVNIPALHIYYPRIDVF